MKQAFRPKRSDDLGLRRALSDRLLPLLVAAMVFLAALALAGAVAAAGLAAHFRWGAGATLTVQVPQPDGPGLQRAAPARGEAVADVLAAAPGLSSRRLSDAEIAALLRPWLGEDAGHLALAMPAVFEVRRLPTQVTDDGLAGRLREAAPGTLVEENGVWFDRLGLLAGSLQACAAAGLLVVAFVAAAVVAVATRAGLAARRDAIEIVHGLGATDAMIASQFAGRVTLLAFLGALLGLALAIPMLLGLAALMAPFQAAPTALAVQQAGGGAADTPMALIASLPALVWALLPALPAAAALIGWATAQATVRSWLGRLT